MDGSSAAHHGFELLRRLRALARARVMHGDSRLLISPGPTPQEFLDFEAPWGAAPRGLVLEPFPDSPFEIRPLQPRTTSTNIGAFCDGTRATYFVGFEDIFPVLYTENAAVVRARSAATGYHASFGGIRRAESMLLAPFGMFDNSVLRGYERLGLCTARAGDLTWFGDDPDARAPSLGEMQALGSLGWQAMGQRRARRLMEVSEQITALAAARVLRQLAPEGRTWLLKDGSLFQFERRYLSGREDLRQIVAAVKTHPVPFFGALGERAIAAMGVGERSVAFLPRPPVDDLGAVGHTLETSPRPMISWYLRVQPPEPTKADRLSGVVRLDIAATEDWRDWVDEISWAVLDEFYGLSARPDPRYDVMPYGIHECEQFLRGTRLPGELLLAALSA